MKVLNRHDVLQLLGGCALFSAVSFVGLSLLVPRLLLDNRVSAMGHDLIRQAWVLKQMHEGDVARANPGEHPLRIWPGPAAPRSSRPQGGPEQPLLLQKLAAHNIRAPLRCQPLPPFRIYCGYWLQINMPNQGKVWIYTAPARALPWLWPLIRTASLLLGCSIALAVFLHRRVQRPIAAMLAHLPAIPTEQLQLVPESGMAAIHTLSVRINRCLASLIHMQESRRRLLQGLAHDFGSPLSRLSMKLEELELDAAGQQQAAGLLLLRSDVNQLIRLTHQLQEAAGPDPAPYRSQPVAVDDLCQRVVASYSHPRIDCRVPRLLAQLDPGLVERALCNVIDNAIRHGAPPIRLTAGLKAHMLVLKLEDAGPGLPSAQLVMPRIAPAHDRQQQERYGLGLSIVERCCQLHGGRLVLERSPLGGLQVELQLPQPG